jgi:dihydroorotate dehydrogenase electron transfer subunit
MPEDPKHKAGRGHMVSKATMSARNGEPAGLRLLARVAQRKAVGSLVWLTLEIPGWPGSRPGQFVLLQPEPSRCFLARAFSVSDEAGARVSFLLAPVGEATVELCGLKRGDRVWVLGPLGNGFDMQVLAGEQGRTVIVGGGVGVAPFPLVLRGIGELAGAPGVRAGEGREGARAGGVEALVLLGFRDAQQAKGAAPVEEAARRLEEAGVSCLMEVVAEDGSLGPAQRVTDVVGHRLRPGDRVVVCGSEAMAEAVWRLCCAVPGVRTWFSLETKMACGVGSCHGCVIELADGSYARVCHEGPVFQGEAVFGA